MDKSYYIRVPKRWVGIAMIVGVSALIVAPLTAVATHSFNDVPNSHTFHGDIEWLKAADVTRGCNPPANNLFCPDDNVTRGQMSAFMKRFSEYLGAEDGTPANADNANQLGDAVPSAYQSRVGGVLVDATYGAGPTAIETITSFSVPTSGGVLVASADVTFFQNSGPQLGAIWIELNENGACEGASSHATYFETGESGFGVDNGSVSTTDSVGPGNHRIDLCAAGLGANTTDVDGSLTVQWVEDSEGATIASADGGRNVADVLADLDELAGDLLDN
jgi:hypothetical protein